MREAGAELWAWLADGAHFYVCGDAKRMAKDVETALSSTPSPQHRRARRRQRPRAIHRRAKKAGRYQADVY